MPTTLQQPRELSQPEDVKISPPGTGIDRETMFFSFLKVKPQPKQKYPYEQSFKLHFFEVTYCSARTLSL
jgi:hypothetical protein